MEWSSVLVCFLYSETVSSPNFESMLTKPYLSWSKSSLINLSESSFPNEILLTKWVCCFFHLLESEDRWLMALFSRWVLILKLPKFYRCEWWRHKDTYRGLNECDPGICSSSACSTQKPDHQTALWVIVAVTYSVTVSLWRGWLVIESWNWWNFQLITISGVSVEFNEAHSTSKKKWALSA